MLRQLRSGGKHTKAIWWLLTVVIVVTFLGGFVFIFGAGVNFGSGQQRGITGSVDGSTISAADYQAALTTQREAFRREYGSDPVDRDEKNAEAQAWRALVSQRLMASQARRAGIVAHDREVVLALQTSPPQELVDQPAFQTDGKFDPAKYRAALSDPNNTFWVTFEELVRSQLPVRKLQERLLSSIKLSEPELREAYHDRFDRVAATAVLVLPDRQAKVPPPQPADLERTYQAYKGRFYSSPRIDVEVLLVPKKYNQDDVRTARQFAQNLVDRVRKGEDFTQLAKDYSEGPAAAQGGVINRVVQADELGPELEPYMNDLQPGQVSNPYQAGGSFIIMKLIERVPQPGQAVPGLRLAQIIVRVRPSDTARQEQYGELQKLRARATALKSLGQAATEKALATTRTGFFDPSTPAPALASTPEAGEWGSGAKLKDVSPIFDGTDNYTIVQVAERHEGGVVPLEPLRETLRQITELEARVDRARPVADRITQALAQGRSLEDAAKENGFSPFATELTRVQGDPRLAGAGETIGALFAAAPGKVVGPLRGPGGWLFARVERRAVAPMDSTYEKAKAQLTKEILTTRQQLFFSGWIGDLRTKAKVQDLRYVGGR
jgi:parvulin-like peptidyl-prolyl isomerase